MLLSCVDLIPNVGLQLGKRKYVEVFWTEKVKALLNNKFFVLRQAFLMSSILRVK